ncbi:hypothetical protein EGW08_011755 [Elysia chlorotica]|uniref:Uncharacterized protein n=1 Tax=Elysia chlorotica TaxID=188477 RepID=A0A433TFW2_ELYCH|nr:hypothetical protein EGW08_011755 [Elysia chlorotica]
MPKSAAEKMREYRARMSNEKRQEMCNKNREQQKASRSKWSEDRRQCESENAKERKKKSRTRMKQTNQNVPLTPLTASCSTPFRTNQSLSKAGTKLHKLYQKVPERRQPLLRNCLTHFYHMLNLKPTVTDLNLTKSFNNFTKVTQFPDSYQEERTL